MSSKTKTKTKTKTDNSSGAPPPKKPNNGGAKMISDSRFASVHSDPRFREAPKRNSKIAIDSRFSRMFTDKNFASSKVRIDKRGKAKELVDNKLKRYYSLDEEKMKKKKKTQKEEFNESDDVEESEEEEKVKNKKRNLTNKNRKVEEEEVESEEEEKGKNKSRKLKEEFKKRKIDESGDEKDSENDEEEESEEEEEKVKNKKRKVKEEFTKVKVDESDEEEEESEEEKLKVKKVLDTQLESESSEEEEEGEEGESDEDTSSTSSSELDSDEEGYVEDEDDAFVQEESIPEIDKETNRLAIVNMDWSQVKAVDLYVLLSSFLPKEGEIKSVAVYPSEFGLQRMEEEAVRGPVGLFDDDKEKEDDDDDDDDEDEEINEKKLREYELSRLRYYYAVVECDSVATADYLYKTCDGVEFERSAVKLDLRFIPDSLELKHQPRDVAREAPPNYDGLDFETRALQQSKVDISWDEDEPQRRKALRRKFNDDELAELELKEFLASDDSEEDDESDDDIADKSTKTLKKKDKYRALLESGEGSGGSEDEEGQDMEVTFNTGLEDISKRILEKKKDKESETVWEAYLRKRKEKKKAKKANANSSDDQTSDSDPEVAEQPDDFFIDEPSTKVKGAGKHILTTKKKSGTAETEASRAELELLLADDNGADSSLKGYNLKPKKAKGKKGKEIPDESKIPTVDYGDPRFSNLFKSPLFALDPTDPQFKRSAVYARQLVQKQRSGDTTAVADDKQAEMPSETLISDDTASKDKNLQSDPQPPKSQKPELSLMVKSIKKKAKKHQASSDEVSRLLPAPKRRKK